MSLSLVSRAARPSLLPAPAPRVSLTALSTRHASLSAIHKGLVRSEKVRPQGARLDKLNDLTESPKRMTYAERRKAREQLAREAPTFKIRKGKKDITEYPAKAKPKSRQARFYDPESSFGKKSLVYQLKKGKLAGELKALRGERTDERHDSPFQRTGPRPDLGPMPPHEARKATRSRDGGRGKDRDDVADLIAELSRPRDTTHAPERDGVRRNRERLRDRDALREGRAAFRDRDAPGRERDRNTSNSRYSEPSSRRDFRDRGAFRDREGGRDSRGSRDMLKPQKEREPLSIPYTTAASQFLYGKSVVEAALRSPRRKLYKLYIYGGANRQNPADDALIQKLAKRKGVPVTIVGEDGLRLLDKMAGSRPHNGFVLEASPLPQPPVAALGPLPDDYAANPRFAVELGHQSAEEAAVNGTPSSIPLGGGLGLGLLLPPTHKPLVVVLDQVLDPGNLGAVLRTVGFLGAAAVGITRKGSATLTPVALKASAGASESLELFSVASLPEFLNGSRANGWSVFAAVAAPAGGNGPKQRRHMDLRDVEDADPLRCDPCVLLIGNEGEGLSRLVVKKADYEVNIPNLSAPGSGVDSLNVSVAAGLLCSSFMRGAAKEMDGLGQEVGVGEDGKPVPQETLW